MTVLYTTIVGLAVGDEWRRDGHWSEGIHFAPETAGSVSPRGGGAPYPSESMIPNPWTAGVPADRGAWAPTPESLGYPREDYSPYQRPAPPQARRYEYLEEESRGGDYPPLERPYSGRSQPGYPQVSSYGYGSGVYGEDRRRYGSGSRDESSSAPPPPSYGVAPYTSPLAPAVGAMGGGLYSPYVPSASPYLAPGTPYAAPSPYLQQFGLGANSLLGLMPLSVTGLPFW